MTMPDGPGRYRDLPWWRKLGAEVSVHLLLAGAVLLVGLVLAVVVAVVWSHLA